MGNATTRCAISMTPKDEWEWVIPLEDWPWYGKLLERIFGLERLKRFTKKSAEYLDGPQDENRCTYTNGFNLVRCVHKVNHKGLCKTALTRTNKLSGKSWTVYQEWYGINYEVQ